MQITNFWCLMFVVVAATVGMGYFALGFASTRIAFVSGQLIILHEIFPVSERMGY